MKVCIVGAGSSYTPELFEKMAEVKERFPVRALTLMDVDAGRLQAVAAFCRRYARHLGLPVEIEATTDLQRAVDGSGRPAF